MRWLVVLSVVAAFGLATGCGEEESIADSEIVEALKLKRSSETGGYTIQGDAFCELDGELLNSASEVEAADSGESKLSLLITSSDASVGVRVVPPFDPDCERDAKRALDSLAEPEE